MPLNNERAILGAWLAWASSDVAACCRIPLRTELAASLAMSASLMREAAAAKFSPLVARRLWATLRRDSTAPYWPSMEEISSIRLVTTLTARLAEYLLSRFVNPIALGRAFDVTASKLSKVVPDISIEIDAVAPLPGKARLTEIDLFTGSPNEIARFGLPLMASPSRAMAP